MRTAVLALAIISILVVSGCVSQEPATGPAEGETNLSGEVGSDLSEVDRMESDLNTSDLENFGSELDDLTW